MQLFRWANEASAIDHVILAMLNVASGLRASLRFATLCTRHMTWREQINELLDRNEAEGADNPPPSGPAVDPEDLQKGRWGGLAERNGRRLEAEIGDVERETFDVDLIVRSTDGSLLQGPVLFHLHDTFPRKTIHIRRIRDGNFAVLEEVNAWLSFTVGAQVKAADGRWTGLELDLATTRGLPLRFVAR
jgi:hypothetical protein